MRIAQACFRFAAPGGAEEHVLQISREMVRRGHEVTVHASDILTETPWERGAWPQNENTDGIKVVRHKAYIKPLAQRWSMLVIPDMISGLLSEDCDIYHAHSHRYFQLEAATCAARAREKPLIITPHYHPAEEKETIRTRMMLRLYDLYSSSSIYRYAGKVLTMTDLEKRFMASMVPSTRCATVGAGIDPEEWKDIPSPELFREKIGVKDPYLLYCGRLASNKGLGTLLDALPAVLKDFNGDMILLGKDWGIKATLEEQARKNGIDRRVRFIDFLPNRELYKSALAGCEMLILPSQWEAFGIVLLEAAMCRRSVVATTVGGIPEVVDHGRTGLLVPYGRSSALSRSIIALLTDDNIRKKMGEYARELVLGRHTWPRVVDRILDAYKEVVARG
jgi:glycosyltransferase involved in cell wall biosynthesis